MLRFFAGSLAILLGLTRLGGAELTFSDCSEGTLRGLVEQGGTIRIACSNVITLTEPLVITRDTSLLSTGPFAISGGDKTRLFVVSPGATLTLSNLGLFNGRQTATNLFTGGVDDTAGGAIYNNQGTVRLHRVTLQANSVIGYPGQAGVDSSTGGPGESGGDAAGAAIFNRTGLVLLSNCVVAANTATGGAGGRGGNSNRGNLGNGGNGGNGGAGGGAGIYSDGGTLLLYNSTFTNNQAVGAQGGAAGTPSGLGKPGQVGRAGDGVGGAIATAGAYVVSSGCTFVNNSAKAANGLAAPAATGNNEGGAGGHGGISSGGAIYNRGALLMTNCTFSANASLAGNGGSGGNGSAAGNFGTDGGRGGNGGIAGGGAIENTYQSSVINCTFAGNRVVAGTAGAGGHRGGVGSQNGPGGAAGEALGGAIYNMNQVSLANSVAANSTGPNFSGAISDLGGNLSTDSSGVFTAASSRVTLTPGLLSLANNGGPTFTIGITTNSPAFNAGLSGYAPLTDQRGTNRTGLIDIGAYEIYFAPPKPTNTTATNVVLSITYSTNVTTLIWPGSATNFVLETTGPSITNVWKVVTNTPTSSRSFRKVEVISSKTSNRFFRLVSGGSNTNTTGGTISTNDLPPIP